MSLTWTPPSPPLAGNDDRVSVTQATCGPFRALCYVIESEAQDRFYYDIDFVRGATVTPYVVKDSGDPKTVGTLNTSAKAQRAAALKLQSIATQMTSTLGVVK